MGFMYARDYRASLPSVDNEEFLEPREIALSNRRKTSAILVVIEEVTMTLDKGKLAPVTTGPRAVYGREVEIEFVGEGRSLSRGLRRSHEWIRQECSTADAEIRGGHWLIMADFPFAACRRYERVEFRPARTDATHDQYWATYDEKLTEAKKARRPDLVTHALELLEASTVLAKDPFNTGAKRLACISIPSQPFDEDRKGPRRMPSLPDGGVDGWAFGLCHDAHEVHRRARLDLFELLHEEAKRQAREDGEPNAVAPELRFAYPPKKVDVGGLRLTGPTLAKVEELANHAVWQAVAGLDPTEAMPKNRLVAEVAWWRLNDLLYNMQRRVETANKR